MSALSRDVICFVCILITFHVHLRRQFFLPGQHWHRRRFRELAPLYNKSMGVPYLLNFVHLSIAYYGLPYEPFNFRIEILGLALELQRAARIHWCNLCNIRYKRTFRYFKRKCDIVKLCYTEKHLFFAWPSFAKLSSWIYSRGLTLVMSCITIFTWEIIGNEFIFACLWHSEFFVNNYWKKLHYEDN